MPRTGVDGRRVARSIGRHRNQVAFRVRRILGAFGDPMKKLVAALAIAGIAGFAAAPASAQSADDLLKKHACLSCHAVDKKLVGPAYKDVAAKYRGQKDAEKLLAEKIKKGGQGVWGPIPMPPNPNVSDADMKVLVGYVLSAK